MANEKGQQKYGTLPWHACGVLFKAPQEEMASGTTFKKMAFPSLSPHLSILQKSLARLGIFYTISTGEQSIPWLRSWDNQGTLNHICGLTCLMFGAVGDKHMTELQREPQHSAERLLKFNLLHLLCQAGCVCVGEQWGFWKQFHIVKSLVYTWMAPFLSLLFFSSLRFHLLCLWT